METLRIYVRNVENSKMVGPNILELNLTARPLRPETIRALEDASAENLENPLFGKVWLEQALGALQTLAACEMVSLERPDDRR